MVYLFHSDYSRACSHCIIERSNLLTDKLLTQWYCTPTLSNSIKKFYGAHYNIIDKHDVHVSKINMGVLTFNIVPCFSLSIGISVFIFPEHPSEFPWRKFICFFIYLLSEFSLCFRIWLKHSLATLCFIRKVK